MMRRFFLSCLLPLLATGFAIAQNSTEAEFKKVRKLAAHREKELFSLFEKKLSREETEAMKFLYAYMPLCDLADYDGEFFLKNVRVSLNTRKFFSWGKNIPDDIFKHFVLPVRVNNESLDTARILFFREIKDRVKNLSMAEAALEVNHWCREKVTYRGTDARTRSPLATMSCAFGRCGEESTFTVAALRSVGIPARQCYTPRWAHSDDNHAWVEVWVDGKWYFMGACEPEAGLNRGWFAVPATRAMMVHTLVTGRYEGPEEVLQKENKFTRINVLSNYAPVKKVIIRALDAEKKPADSVTVNFGLYNYAEFYPIATRITDASGYCSLSTGFGELLIWCNKKNRFGFEKLTVRSTDTLTVVMDKSEKISQILAYDFVPPAAGTPLLAPGSGNDETNATRIVGEDKIRAAYESTFLDSLKAVSLAKNRNISTDSTYRFIKKSRGNWKTIYHFLESTPDPGKALLLLSSVNDKDLSDIKESVLQDQMRNAPPRKELHTSFYAQYVLSPRFEYEQLLPWRAPLKAQFSSLLKGTDEEKAEQLKAWTLENIKINDSLNYYKVPLTPSGVLSLRVADKRSRNIFVAAAARSVGIPARIEVSAQKPQYFYNTEWRDFYPSDPVKNASEKPILVLQKDPMTEKNPEYYIHYTLEKFENGVYKTLDFEEDPRLKKFPCSLPLDPGNYLCVTGTRKNDGSVLTRLEFFELKPGETKMFPLVFRAVEGPRAVLGSLDLNRKVQMNGTSQPMPLKNLSGEAGTFFIWADADKEPTRHVVADLSKIKETLNKWNGKFVFLFKNKNDLEIFKSKNSPELPAHVLYAVDGGDALDGLRMNACKKSSGELPLIIYSNKKGEVFYHSEGYIIGTDGIVLDLIR